MPRRIVIIGHGPAGRTAAGYASLTDRNAEITVLNASEHDVYHPCSLPFAIGGHVDLDAIVEEVHYRKVRLLNRTRATAIDPEARTVSAVGPDGEEMALGYDALLIATGSRPVVPAAIESTDRPEVLTLRTPHDAAAIIERAGTARRAVVVGGSAIGLELSSELAGRGISTTLVEAETTLMPGRLDPDMSSAVERHLGADGVDVVTGCPVTAIRPADDDRAVLVRAGDRTFGADLVVMALGVAPQIDLARAAGCDIGPSGGIRVAPRMETFVPGIYAAGDCVETVDLVTGRPTTMCLAGIATRQGRVAGIVMAGGDASFPGAVGSWVVATRSFMVGGTGLTDRAAAAAGFDVVSSRVNALLRPHYISDERIGIRLVADRSGRLLGGQVIGRERVAETVNYLALALMAGLDVEGLTVADWCYAPLATECLVPMASAADAILRRMR